MYDLIIRDATIVTSQGRQVADVAVKNGKIAYVGPRPPRKAREEVSAIGRFLMPGVIDTAVQFDPNGDEGIWERESRAAVSGGVTTVISLPGGDQPVIDLDSARRRYQTALKGSWCHWGLWGGASKDNLGELSSAHTEGLIVGTLAYLPTTENTLGIKPSDLEDYLDTEGVLGVQLEMLDDMASNHTEKILAAAEKRGRPIHLVHLSTAAELNMIDPVRGALPVTAGVTPHHLFLSTEEGGFDGLEPNPPMRAEHDRRTLWTAVKRGRLDCVASDHHNLPGGVPGSELLFPLMLSAVKYGRLSLELLVSLCSESPARIFGLESKGRIEKGADADMILFAEGEVAKVERSSLLSGADSSPYVNREAAPKPDLVIVAGQIVARNGQLVADKPLGQPIKCSA